ncbi:hypothetical protein AZF37_06375 [endosymbiont 'TC1' of Trimyema compressum]|uniref:HAMP domain-containing protein n=1 Tax=endosymbiont 'TC1' of Trimyema compressum TaxID=243899 RepID=UPI0007F10C57|nr:HAMP domain-containing protein [endosymbiont 'TC1' of Trimyema compressum]AMP20847.1 hypothetical protein AZF37_06375 [endosymbiont 'TC1' of Trimyema compressum]
MANTKIITPSLLSSFLYFIAFLINLLGIGTLVGYLFYSRRIKVPLKLLIEAFQKIESEELNFKVDYLINDEFGLLIQSVEQMRQSLESYYLNNGWTTRNNENTKDYPVRKSLKNAFAWSVTVSLLLTITLFGISLGFLDSISQFLPFDRYYLAFVFLLIFSLFFSVIASFIFFQRRLKKPINLLVNSSKKC